MNLRKQCFVETNYWCLQRPMIISLIFYEGECVLNNDSIELTSRYTNLILSCDEDGTLTVLKKEDCYFGASDWNDLQCTEDNYVLATGYTDCKT